MPAPPVVATPGVIRRQTVIPVKMAFKLDVGADDRIADASDLLEGIDGIR